MKPPSLPFRTHHLLRILNQYEEQPYPLDLFLKNLPAEMEQIRQAKENNNIALLYKCVHKLHGAASYCGVVIRTKSNEIGCIAYVNTENFLSNEACILKAFNIKRTSSIIIELSSKSHNTCSVSVRSSI